MSEEPPKRHSKLCQRLATAKNSKQFYETHQLCKTLFNRLNTTDPVEAEIVLNEGAQFLLTNNQSESGADLVITLLKFYILQKWPANDDIIIKLKNYFSRMNKHSNERKSMIIQSHQWLSTCGSSIFSDLFNNWIALILWKEENYTDARYYFVLSGNGVHTAMFLLHMHLHCGYRQERDLFIMQAVLQYLCLEKFSSASVTFYIYINNHPDLESGPPFNNYPLLNFIWFLMIAIESKLSKAVFTTLCERYSKHLLRDPVYNDYLARIGQIYFHIAPAKNPDSFISNIVNMLIGNGNSAGDNQENNRSSASLNMDSNFTSEDMD